jgi:hypothetical protein
MSRWGWTWVAVNALLLATIVLVAVDEFRAALVCSLVTSYLLVVTRKARP